MVIEKRSKEIEEVLDNACKLLGVEYFDYELRFKGGIALSLDCHELNNDYIDVAIESLNPYLQTDSCEYESNDISSVIRILLGFCYIRKGDFHKAIDLLNFFGDKSAMWVAYCYSKVGEHEKAVKILQKLPDENIESRLVLALLFAEIQEYETAKRILNTLLKNKALLKEGDNPNKLGVFLTLGQIYEKLESYTKAVNCYEKILVEDIFYKTSDGISISEKIKSLRQKMQVGGNDRHHISKEVRREVWLRDKGHCVECGSNKKLEFDHIIPVSKGGSNTTRNIRLLCEECNRKKSDNI